jgi:hypothetical protein
MVEGGGQSSHDAYAARWTHGAWGGLVLGITIDLLLLLLLLLLLRLLLMMMMMMMMWWWWWWWWWWWLGRCWV